MAKQGQGDRLKHTYSSSVRIRDVAQSTCQKHGTIRRSGERGSGISVLVARQDDEMMKTTHHCGSARGVMVIVGGNGHGNTSSNPGRD